MDIVISQHALKSILEAKNLLLVDTRPFASYAESHIPGAVNQDLMQFHWIDSSRLGVAHFNEQMRLLLSNIGVSAEKQVVFYDDVSGASAARGVWLLSYFSHKKVVMLDGGFKLWKSLGYKTETNSNPFKPAKFKGRPDPRVLAGFARVRAAAKSNNGVIIDARSSQEYNGAVVRAARAGHIPGAINIDWNDNLNGSSFKSAQTLEKMYSDIPKNAEIITYCQGGYRAANTFVVLRMLGFKNVRMYLGSWGEWGNRHDLPVSHK